MCPFSEPGTHQSAGFCIKIFKKIPGVIPPDPVAGGGDPLPAPTPSTAFGRTRGPGLPRLRGPSMPNVPLRQMIVPPRLF